MKPGGVLGSMAVLLALSQSAMAACPTPGRPFIEVLVAVEPPDRIIADTLVKHLRAELSGRSIDVCEQATSPSQLARVKLHVKRDGSGSVIAFIGLEDTLLKKGVTREIDLTALPDDVRPTTVATAADELLRAAWTELTLDDAPPPTSPPPVEVVRAVQSTQRQSPSPPERFEIGPFAAGSTSPQRKAIGAGVLGYGWWSPNVGAVSTLEVSRGLAVSSADGESRIDTASIGIGPAVSLFSDHSRSGLRLEILMLGTLARSSGDAGQTAHGTSAMAATVELSTGARVWVRTGGLGWSLGVALRVPIRPVRADDERTTVTAVEGAAGVLSLGAAFVR